MSKRTNLLAKIFDPTAPFMEVLRYKPSRAALARGAETGHPRGIFFNLEPSNFEP
jgi:hypothetical protein